MFFENIIASKNHKFENSYINHRYISRTHDLNMMSTTYRAKYNEIIQNRVRKFLKDETAVHLCCLRMIKCLNISQLIIPKIDFKLQNFLYAYLHLQIQVQVHHDETNLNLTSPKPK